MPTKEMKTVCSLTVLLHQYQSFYCCQEDCGFSNFLYFQGCREWVISTTFPGALFLVGCHVQYSVNKHELIECVLFVQMLLREPDSLTITYFGNRCDRISLTLPSCLLNKCLGTTPILLFQHRMLNQEHRRCSWLNTIRIPRALEHMELNSHSHMRNNELFRLTHRVSHSNLAGWACYYMTGEL